MGLFDKNQNSHKYQMKSAGELKPENSNELDGTIKEKSEENYIEIVKNIVETSKEQLNAQRDNKKKLRKGFTIFFCCFISIQFVVLMLIVFFKGFCSNFTLNENVIMSLVASIFIETLGAIVIMIRFAFDSQQEITILETLNTVVENFQKFNR